MGGTPILGPLAEDLAANRIIEVRGHRQRHDEPHPHRDGDGPGLRGGPRGSAGGRLRRGGPDRRRRGRSTRRTSSSILARLAFGAWLDRGAIVRAAARVDGAAAPGITGGHAEDLAAAAERAARSGSLAPAPRRRRRHDPTRTSCRRRSAATAASARPTASAIASRSRATGSGWSGSRGPGAGGAATAAAVLADLLAIAAGGGCTWAPCRAAGSGGAGTRARPTPPDGSRRAALPAAEPDRSMRPASRRRHRDRRPVRGRSAPSCAG